MCIRDSLKTAATLRVAHCLSHLIDDADKRVGRLGHALAIRGAIRFCAVVAASATHDDAEEVTAIAAFAEDLRQRCEAAGENRLARRAEGAHRSLTSGSVYANIKSVAKNLGNMYKQLQPLLTRQQLHTVFEQAAAMVACGV